VLYSNKTFQQTLHTDFNYFKTCLIQRCDILQSISFIDAVKQYDKCEQTQQRQRTPMQTKSALTSAQTDKKAVLSQRWPRDARYISSRFGDMAIWNLSNMAVAAILDLFEL